MKEISIFTLVFTIINVYIYFLFEYSTCVDNNTKFYVILFYVASFVYIGYLLLSNKSFAIVTPGTDIAPIIIDLLKNAEYNKDSSKIIYWGVDFNVNGVVDIVDSKVTIPVNKQTSLKYRIIDINEKLSNVYDA